MSTWKFPDIRHAEMQNAQNPKQIQKKLEEPSAGYWPQTLKWILFETEILDEDSPNSEHAELSNGESFRVSALAFADNLDHANLAIEQYANGQFLKYESKWDPKPLHKNSNQLETMFDANINGRVLVMPETEIVPKPSKELWPYEHWILDVYDEENSPNTRVVSIMKHLNVIHRFEFQTAPLCFPAEMERRTEANKFFDEIDEMTRARLRGECGGEFVATQDEK